MFNNYVLEMQLLKKWWQETHWKYSLGTNHMFYDDSALVSSVLAADYNTNMNWFPVHYCMRPLTHQYAAV